MKVLVTGARGQLAGAIIDAYAGEAEVLAYLSARARHHGRERASCRGSAAIDRT